MRKKDEFDLRKRMHPIDFFTPRWISRYIVESILKFGAASEAYNLLIQDASKEWLRLSKPVRRLKCQR